MSSAGHVLDMLNRYRANRQLLTSRGRKKSLGQIRAMYAVEQKQDNDRSVTNLSQAELAEIRKTVVLKIRKQRIRSLIITWIVGIILVAGGIWLFVILILV